MTVWIYVDTSKQVGDKDHLKVFADACGKRGAVPRQGVRRQDAQIITTPAAC